jgi:hypothetical protein
MATFNKVNIFVQDLANKVHNLGADVLKVVLTNTAPTAASTNLASLVDLTTGGGYTAGGGAVSTTSCVQTAGTLKLVVADLVFTATTGFGPFRYAVLTNSTAAGQPVIGWYDYGSSISLQASETFTVDFDQANGVLTIA